MSAYLIVDVDITDPAAHAEYRKQAPKTLEPYGGKYLVRAGAHQTLEGDWHPKRLIVLEFPSVEHAKRWHASEEYRGPKALRMRAATSRMVVVEGVADSSP
jgi:uncharacterized protein (DUF1330 family)